MAKGRDNEQNSGQGEDNTTCFLRHHRLLSLLNLALGPGTSPSHQRDLPFSSENVGAH